MRIVTRSSCERSCSNVVAVLVALALTSCGGSSSSSSTPTSNVTVFTMPEAIKAETGAGTISPKSIIPYSDSRLVLFDESSESLLQLGTNGSPVRHRRQGGVSCHHGGDERGSRSDAPHERRSVRRCGRGRRPRDGQVPAHRVDRDGRRPLDDGAR